jgi:hypothetical protein
VLIGFISTYVPSPLHLRKCIDLVAARHVTDRHASIALAYCSWNCPQHL